MCFSHDNSDVGWASSPHTAVNPWNAGSCWLLVRLYGKIVVCSGETFLTISVIVFPVSFVGSMEINKNQYSQSIYCVYKFWV